VDVRRARTADRRLTTGPRSPGGARSGPPAAESPPAQRSGSAPAVRVDPGATVTWTGQSGSHNVAGDGFESELTDSGDDTFEKAGVYTCVCTPHGPLGTTGVVGLFGAFLRLTGLVSEGATDADICPRLLGYAGHEG